MTAARLTHLMTLVVVALVAFAFWTMGGDILQTLMHTASVLDGTTPLPAPLTGDVRGLVP